MVAYPADAVTIMKQGADLGITNIGLFPDSTKSNSFVENIAQAVGNDAIEGITGVAGATPAGHAADIFNTLFEAKYGHAAHPFSTNAYDSIFLIALAIEMAGTATDGAAIRDALRKVANPPGEVVTANEFAKAVDFIRRGIAVNYEGASGSVDFDENGDSYAPVGVWEIRNATIVEVELIPAEELQQVGK